MGIELVLAIIFFLVMEGLFTGSEIAIISVDRGFLKDEAGRGRKYAAYALEMLEKPERMFATSLTGTDICVVANTVIVTTYLIGRFGNYGEIVSVAILSPLVLILGEVMPKTFFQAYSERIIPFAAYFLTFFGYIFSPVIAVVTSVSQVFLKVFRVDVPAKLGVTREELITMATKYRRAEDVEEHEQTMVGRVFEYSEAKVKDVMVPLVDVVAFKEDTPIKELIDVASVKGFSRYPIFRERVDNVTGFVNILDAFTVRSHDMPLSTIKRRAFFIPELMPIDELLELLKKEAKPIGIAIDEFGGVTGIITIEDILEEVVGEIEDEFDSESLYLRKEGEGVYVVSGRTPIKVIEEIFDVSLAKGDYTTLSGYIIDICGCKPQSGDIAGGEGLELEILRTSEKTIDLVRIRKGG